jgi:hypothetical protein
MTLFRDKGTQEVLLGFLAKKLSCYFRAVFFFSLLVCVIYRSKPRTATVCYCGGSQWYANLTHEKQRRERKSQSFPTQEVAAELSQS